MRATTMAIWAAAALLLASCWESGQQSDTAAPAAQFQSWASAPAVPAEDAEEVVGSYPDKYAEEPGVRQCLAQSAHSCLSTAVQNDARKGSDPKICDAISEPNFRSSCKNMVAMGLAAESGDSKACGVLPDGMGKRECVIQAHTSKARKSRDHGSCSEIAKALPVSKSGSGSQADYRADAWTKATQSDAVDRCVATVVSEYAKDADACEEVSNPFFRKQCESTVLMRNPARPTQAQTQSGSTARTPQRPGQE